jgi:hypothetical protein
MELRLTSAHRLFNILKEVKYLKIVGMKVLWLHMCPLFASNIRHITCPNRNGSVITTCGVF